MSLTVEKCLQAWTNSLKQLNTIADIVFFGDSLTYFGNFSILFPDRVVCNLGLRGDTIKGMINRVEQVKILKPQTIFLMAGINDASVCSIVLFQDLYKQLIQRLLAVTGGARIIIQNMLPVNDEVFCISCNNDQILECNKVIAKLSDYYGCGLIDLFSLYSHNGILPKEMTVDGLHLTPESYDIWYSVLKNDNMIR